MSSTSRSILIGSLIGAAVGGAIAWAYHEFTTADDQPTARFRFEANATDMMKLGIAAIPLVRMLTDFFVPFDDSAANLPD